MSANGTNKTNLASVKTAINTFETNAAGATDDAKLEMRILCKTLRRDIARFEDGIKGLV